MPKEVIYSSTNGYRIAPNGGEHSASSDAPLPEGTSDTIHRRAVHVGWSRNRYVEVGVAQFEIATEKADGGIYLDLDREGINRLIRTLRKARDAAFGSDA